MLSLTKTKKVVDYELPPIDRQNDLFNYIRRLGEAYAAAHGPHPGIDPRKFPSLSEFGLEDETPDFNSAQRLREVFQRLREPFPSTGGGGDVPGP